jgi:hypothetical protein
VEMIVFIYFTEFLNMLNTKFVVPLLCSIATVATQDPHAQPPDVGRAVCAVHTACGIPAPCSPRVPRSADDGLRRVDGTCGLVAHGDPHVPAPVSCI